LPIARSCHTARAFNDGAQGARRPERRSCGSLKALRRRGGGTRRQSAGIPRVLAMTKIDALTTAQRLALARFIETYVRLRGSMRWRTAFCECARRGHFYPYATTEETNHLMRLANDFGPLIVCQFKTADVQGVVREPGQLRSSAPSSGARA
jgi:hypothetical protein